MHVASISARLSECLDGNRVSLCVLVSALKCTKFTSLSDSAVCSELGEPSDEEFRETPTQFEAGVDCNSSVFFHIGI